MLLCGNSDIELNFGTLTIFLYLNSLILTTKIQTKNM